MDENTQVNKRVSTWININHAEVHAWAFWDLYVHQCIGFKGTSTKLMSHYDRLQEVSLPNQSTQNIT